MSAQTRVDLGKRIRQLRKERHLTQETFALMVNIERSYFVKIEQGKRNPGFDHIEKIADGLGVSLSELFKGIGPHSEPTTNEFAKDRDRMQVHYASVKLPR